MNSLRIEKGVNMKKILIVETENGVVQNSEDITIVDIENKEKCKQAFDEFAANLNDVDETWIEEFKMDFEEFFDNDEDCIAFDGFDNYGTVIGLSFVRKEI